MVCFTLGSICHPIHSGTHVCMHICPRFFEFFVVLVNKPNHRWFLFSMVLDFFNLKSGIVGVVLIQLVQILNTYQLFLRLDADLQSLVGSNQ
jgi:hypothetical protein